MTAPPLVAVAHGSRDASAQRTVRQLLERVRALLPQVSVHEAYVQNASPALGDVLSATAGEAVVVPLLLARGYHVSVDIGVAAARAGARVAAPLGPDAALSDALADRLAQAGVPDDVPVVLAAAGSSDPRAVTDVEAQAALLQTRRRVAVVAAYATAGTPTVADAVEHLRRRSGPVATAAFVLAPGSFAARIRAVGATWSAAPLGSHPAVAELTVRRYLDAAGVRDD